MKVFINLAVGLFLVLAIGCFPISPADAKDYDLAHLLDTAANLKCNSDGHQFFYITDQQLKLSYRCTDLKPNGPFSAYYKEIDKVGKGYFRNGKLHGEFMHFEFLETLVLPFKDGAISGTVSRKDRSSNNNGSYTAEVQDDVTTGNVTFQNGRLETYRNGLRIHPATEFKPKQPLDPRSLMTLSASTCKRKLDMNAVNYGDFIGKLKCSVPNQKNTQRILTPFGIIRAEFQCEDGSPNGAIQAHQVISSGNFMGTLLLEGNLKNGDLVGDFKRFQHGKPLQFGSINNGKLHGLITQFDDSGPVFSVKLDHGRCSSPLTYFEQSKFNQALSEETLYQEKKKIFVVIGMDGATGFGPPRFGPNLSILKGECKDGCGGIGPTFGLYNRSRKEYYLGIAAGMAYMFSGWAEAAVHSIDKKVTGFHGTIAMGIALMPFFELGYDLEDKRPSVKLGLTVKAPIYPLIK